MMPEPWDDPDDDMRDPWCRSIVAHSELHEFCTHHQAAWCRRCDRGGCPQCSDDPHCNSCGAAVWEEDHNWDCPHAGEDES